MKPRPCLYCEEMRLDGSKTCGKTECEAQYHEARKAYFRENKRQQRQAKAQASGREIRTCEKKQGQVSSQPQKRTAVPCTRVCGYPGCTEHTPTRQHTYCLAHSSVVTQERRQRWRKNHPDWRREPSSAEREDSHQRAKFRQRAENSRERIRRCLVGTSYVNPSRSTRKEAAHGD